MSLEANVVGPVWSCRVPAVSFGSTRVLATQDLSFEVGVNSLVGRNGAGKTTLYRCLLGLLPGCESIVQLTTGAGVASTDRAGFMSRIGYLPQDVPHPRSMSTLDFVVHAAWLKGLGRDASARASAALTLVDLANQARTRTSALSGGMRRRAGLAAAIVHDPTVLVLDEPTSGLDPLERARFHALVGSLAADHIVLVSTHLLEDVEGMGGDVSVLSSGIVRGLGSVHELTLLGPLRDSLMPELGAGAA